MKYFICVFILFAFLACSKHSSQTSESGATQEKPIITIDGSSTVFPISEAVAEEFQKIHKDQKVTVAMSGTGGGFKKFCNKEIIITGASRPIKPSEVEQCSKNNISYIELPVAYDGIAIVVHPKNNWVDSVTVAEMQKLWDPEAQDHITKWNQIRKTWPDKEIHLFGAGVDSGTYDYFTYAIVGKEHSSRGDYTSSEDDNVLVQGIAGDQYSLGFFGFAYYTENKDKLKLIAVDDQKSDNGEGAIQPSFETVMNGTYQPLSRPIFIYVRGDIASESYIESFIQYYIGEGSKLVSQVGYIPFKPETYNIISDRFKNKASGSLFGGHGSSMATNIETLLKNGK